jgi:uncharacterized membrane protein
MRIKHLTTQQLLNFTVIFLMIAGGAYIRFYNITLKTIWTDEVASIVYGLGNSFTDVPLNKIIDLEVLLQPLRIDNSHGLVDVIKYGIFEDFVPPLHFIFFHVWIFLFKTSNKIVSVFTARSLSAFFSVFSIPSIYLLTKILFKRNRTIWLLASLLITLSPYSIALAQEARHYSIAIVFVILSMLVFFHVTEQIIYDRPLPIAAICVLAGLNFLGVASHYFFIIVLISEVIALVTIVYQYKLPVSLFKISVVSFVNILAGLVWLPVYFLNDSRDELTAWAHMDITKIDVIANFLLQPIIASITMLFLLPVESSNIQLAILSALVMLVAMFFLSLLIFDSIKSPNYADYDLPIKFLSIYLISSIAILIIISYLFEKNFLVALRYHFMYFPPLIILISYFVSDSLKNNHLAVKIKNLNIQKNILLYMLATILFISSCCIVNNLSFPKSFRADTMAGIIRANSDGDILIATTHKTLSDTSNLIALGWQFADISNKEMAPKFFLEGVLSHGLNGITLQDAIQTTIGKTSLWLINYDGNLQLNNCLPKKSNVHMPGYRYKYYQCL